MKMCILCGVKEATVPDRESTNRQNSICVDCHGARLREDLRNILKGSYRKNTFRNLNHNKK